MALPFILLYIYIYIYIYIYHCKVHPINLEGSSWLGTLRCLILGLYILLSLFFFFDTLAVLRLLFSINTVGSCQNFCFSIQTFVVQVLYLVKLIKVCQCDFQIQVEPDSYVHARVYKTLPSAGGTLEVTAVEVDKSEADSLVYFFSELLKW